MKPDPAKSAAEAVAVADAVATVAVAAVVVDAGASVAAVAVVVAADAIAADEIVIDPSANHLKSQQKSPRLQARALFSRSSPRK
jgi:hypothetical protein